MVYDMAIVPIYGAFAGRRRIMELTKKVGIVVDDVRKTRHIWNRQRVVGGEFKVFFHYNEKYSENVKEWSEENDIKKRYYN